MTNTPLDMRCIYKRERFLEKRKSITENAVIPNLSNCNKMLYKQKVENYLQECSSYKDAIKILKTLYEDNNFELLEMATQRVINDIIPMVESSELPSCISLVESSNIGNINIDRITEAARAYKSIDRMIKNNRNMSKRFDLNESIMKHGSDREKCFKVCEMVNTYDLSRFIKFNIALEEIAYIGYMNGNRMPDNIMVENVSDYFLMIDDNTGEDIDSYKRAIASSKIISEGADSNVSYLMNGTKPSDYWKDRINEWKINYDKKLSTLIEIARENYSNLSVLNSVINTINEFCKINSIEFNPMDIFTENVNSLNSGEANNIIQFIKENKIEDSKELLDDLYMVWEVDLNDKVYDDGTETPETFTSKEIDKFKMHNLISDSIIAGEFLDQLEKTSMKESPITINKISSWNKIKIDESNLLDNIDDNGYISMNLRSYSYNGDIESAAKLLESSIKCLNNILYNKDTKAYFNLYNESFDICLRSKYKVILSEAEELSRGFSRSDKEMILKIKEYADLFESINRSDLSTIVDTLVDDKDITATITAQETALLYDILGPIIESSTEDTDGFLNKFIGLCNYEANPQYNQIKRECSDIQHEAFELNEENILTRIDFCSDILGINEGHLKDAAKKVGDTVKKIIPKKKTIDDKDEDYNDDDADKLTYKDSDDKSKEKNKVDIKEKINGLKKKKSEDDDSEEDESNNKSQKDDEDLEEDKDSKDDKKEEKFQSPKQSEDNSKTDKKSVEPPDDRNTVIKGITNAKLAWQGVKSKLKNASSKEKEMSRDLDLEFNHLVNSIKTTFGNDRREEIITGEVNRSFSKIIKIGIALAGAGAVTGNIIIPIIGAVGLFARSKFLTYKEKKLILDEIEIELQVVDREIQRAESSGSSKKYRQLLTIQRNLARKRNEIQSGMMRKNQHIAVRLANSNLRPRE